MIASDDRDFTTALTSMHGATPVAAMIEPGQRRSATAGALNANEFSPIALPISSRGTSSETQLWRAGASNDCVAALQRADDQHTGKDAVS